MMSSILFRGGKHVFLNGGKSNAKFAMGSMMDSYSKESVLAVVGRGDWTTRRFATEVATTSEAGEAEDSATVENHENVRISVQKKNISGSTKKNNRIAQLIRGMHAEDALAQLYFTKKRRKDAFIHVIKRGVNRAALEHDIPQNRLKIAEVFVTKGQMLKRPRFHARGRTGKNFHRFSHIKMVLEEAEELPPLGQREKTSSNWASKFKGGKIPKDLSKFSKDLIFPYQSNVPHFTERSV